MSIKQFMAACLCTLCLAVPVFSQANDSNLSREQLMKELPEKYKSKFEEIYRLMSQNMTLHRFRKQGMSNIKKADMFIFNGAAKIAWLTLQNTYEPVVWGDFFTGTIILTGAYDETRSVTALYNPWWDAIFLMRMSRNEKEQDVIQSFEIRSGESFRGDALVFSKDAPAILEPVVAVNERLPLTWMDLLSRTVKVFDAKYGDISCLGDPALFSNGYDQNSQVACGVRAVARLQLMREMFKNKGVMAEALSWMKVLREATPEQAAKLPLDTDELDMLRLLIILGPDFRKGITPYGYWGTEQERQYLFVCSDNPRLVMMVYVHVGKGLDFEWFDMNEADKYLKKAAEARH